jgi:hypothetical protein
MMQSYVNTNTNKYEDIWTPLQLQPDIFPTWFFKVKKEYT